MESQQWVVDIAEKGRFPYVTLEKIRRSDIEVTISVPIIPTLQSSTPLLVDDIISSARTMMESMKHLQNAGVKSVMCIGMRFLQKMHAPYSGSDVSHHL